MRVRYKDYYHILNVARTAGDREIQKAYRKLALQYHPDVASDKSSAEIRFKEINEAYEVLGDARKRRKYDRLTVESAEFNFSTQWSSYASHAGAYHSHDGNTSEFHSGGEGTFHDFLREYLKNNRAHGHTSEQEESSHFNESNPNFNETPVNEVALTVSLQEVLHGSVRPVTVQHRRHCTSCRGTGRYHAYLCSSCRGQGHFLGTETYQIKIPSGVADGQRLRVRGRATADGILPDFYVRIRFEDHPILKTKGQHLYYDLEIAPWEAVLGTTAAVPTLDGRVNIRIPAGSKLGQRLRLKGYGLPFRESGRGDLIVTVAIKTPKNAGVAEKLIWEKLAGVSKAHS